MADSFDYAQAKQVLQFIKDHPNQTFYLDEPFLNGVIMDHYHLLLRNMDHMTFIKSHPPVMEGMSPTYSAIPRVGYNFVILDKGNDLLNTQTPPIQ